MSCTSGEAREQEAILESIRQQLFPDADLRKRQIITLKIFNENVIEKAADREYAISFESGGRNFLLTIHLNDGFPNERPKLVVDPLVQHYWVDADTGEVELAPGLLNYSRNSVLGHVVRVIVGEFERLPLAIRKSVSLENIPCLTASPAFRKRKSLDSGSQMQPLKSSDRKQNCSLPNVSEFSLDEVKLFNTMKPLKSSDEKQDCSLPNLSNLSLDELKLLDKNPEFFNGFIETMSVIQHLNEDLDLMADQLEIVSQTDESKNEHLLNFKQRLSENVSAVEQLSEKCDQLNRMSKMSADFPSEHAQKVLQTSSFHAENVSDSHVEQFLNGNMNVKTFLKNHIISKKTPSQLQLKHAGLF